MIFRNGRVILADIIRDDLDVVIAGEKIVELRERGDGRDFVDLRGRYLAPGFVDLHLHGAVGRDSMEASPEAFAQICNFHLSGGTTSLLLTSVTAEMDRIICFLKAAREMRAKIPALAGAHVEGPFISRAKAGAQNPAHICEPTRELVQQLLDYADVIRRITLAPEVPGAVECIKQFAAAGISVSGGHSDAWEEEAKRGFDAGMRSVSHTFNCMSSARRRGRERVAGLLEVALSEPRIHCELIADGHHVSPTLVKMLWAAKGTGGISLVTDAIAGAGLNDGARFILGATSCVVENGVCLLADRSALAGSAARMIDLVRTLVQKIGVPLPEAVALASRNPAQQIGLGGKGEIKVGNDADFAVLSPKLEVEETWLRGRLACRTGR